ncbi:hypothetical protein N431DRAFT_534408 [Stipitochalara longipes BDJ]|nr:hypothetical protein N431DRAFT_534408 [Stipitochalara longipes BDJ]
MILAGIGKTVPSSPSTWSASINSGFIEIEKMFRQERKQHSWETPAAVSGSNQADANTKSPKRPIYFKVPLLMVVSLLVGTLLAIGNHLFFKSLDGHPVPDHRFGIWSFGERIETGRFSAMDFGPSVALLACGVWIVIPLAAISPSGTLTTQLTTTNITQPMRVPNIDYAINSFAVGGGLPFGQYNGPTSDISRLVDNVVSQGSVLNLTENAPFLPIQQLRSPKLIDNLVNSSSANAIESSALYAAFTPNGEDVNTNLTAAILQPLESIYQDTYVFKSYVDEASTDYQRLFIYYINGNASTLQCGLYNASYQVDFNLNNGAQSVNLKNITYLNGVVYKDNSPYELLDCYHLQEYCGSDVTEAIPTASFTTSILNNAAYQAVMNALNSFFVGHIDNGGINFGALISNTRILSSFLSTTPELQHVASFFGGSNSTSNTSLSQSIEELSQSITISLFSSPKFLQGAKSQTSEWAPFSTVLRTTRHVELDALFLPTARTGADPLPKNLAKRTLTLKSHTGVDSDLFQSENSQGSLNGTQNGTHVDNGKTMMHMSENRVGV